MPSWRIVGPDSIGVHGDLDDEGHDAEALGFATMIGLEVVTFIVQA